MSASSAPNSGSSYAVAAPPVVAGRANPATTNSASGAALAIAKPPERADDKDDYDAGRRSLRMPYGILVFHLS